MYISLYRKMSIAIGFLLVTMTTGIVFGQQTEAVTSGSSAQEIVFSNNRWKEVVAEAKRSDKYIFVDAYASWCGPCKLLKSTTFRDKNAATYFNKNFINYTADMEKGESVELAEKWDITAYPALLFFDPDGNMVLMQIGYVDGRKLVEFGKQALAKR